MYLYAEGTFIYFQYFVYILLINLLSATFVLLSPLLCNGVFVQFNIYILT